MLMETNLSVNITQRHDAAAQPTVVLLHSSGSSSRQWAELAEQLQPDFRVCAIDLHGHGTRPAWSGPAPFTLAQDAELVEPILRDAGRVHLVGHSYGGAIALQLAAAHPHAIASLAAYEPMAFHWLMDAAVSDGSDASDGWGDGTAARAALSMAGVAHFVGEALLRDAAHEAGQVFVDFWTGDGSWQRLAAGQRDSIARRMRTVHRHFGAIFRAVWSRGQIARVAAPMLLLSGERSVPAGQQVAAQLRMALPLAEHVTLPGMGHMGPVTHAAEVNWRIAGFLRDQLDAPFLRRLQRCA